MFKIKCLIVDDEPPAVDLLLGYAKLTEQLEIVGTSHSAVRAFDLLKEKEIDLVFLDIQLPVLNGIDFLKTVSNPPAVILTTAYREYAIDGYDLDIIDYLLKPIAFDRFLKAVDRYSNRVLTKKSDPIPQTKSAEYIFCNINRTQHKVYLDDILYVESLKDYVRIHTCEERLVVKGNIGSFMKKLPSDRFVRIHRSHAVALSQIKSFNQSEVFLEGHRLLIGASYRVGFMEKLGR